MSRSDKEVILQPLTWENIDDLVATDSSTEYFPLPTNEDEIIRHMGLVSNQ